MSVPYKVTFRLIGLANREEQANPADGILLRLLKKKAARMDSIKIVKQTADADGDETDEPALVGLRDRALIGVMVYTFARVNAVLLMKVRDYFVQGRRGWVRLHEKGGKEHEVPCHHSLERYLDEYIAAAGIAEEPDAPLFQTAAGKTGTLTGKAMWQQDAYRMIQRRTRDTGIKTRIGKARRFTRLY